MRVVEQLFKWESRWILLCGALDEKELYQPKQQVSLNSVEYGSTVVGFDEEYRSFDRVFWQGWKGIEFILSILVEEENFGDDLESSSNSDVYEKEEAAAKQVKDISSDNGSHEVTGEEIDIIEYEGYLWSYQYIR